MNYYGRVWSDVSINLENKVIHLELVPGETVDDDRVTQWVTDAGYAKWRTRYAACPVDPQQARACQMLRTISRVILIITIGIYAVGGFFAFAAGRLLL